MRRCLSRQLESEFIVNGGSVTELLWFHSCRKCIRIVVSGDGGDRRSRSSMECGGTDCSPVSLVWLFSAPSHRKPHAPNHYSDTFQAWIETTILLHNRQWCCDFTIERAWLVCCGGPTFIPPGFLRFAITWHKNRTGDCYEQRGLSGEYRIRNHCYTGCPK